MSANGCRAYHYRRIALFGFFIFLFASLLDLFLSGQSWPVILLRSFVYTFACTFFCTVLICRFIVRISAFSRLIYYLFFSLLIIAGITLGVLVGTLILERSFIFRFEVFAFSLLIGFLFSVAITSYLLLRENLKNKISRLKDIEIENERLKRYESEARLSFLKAKLNPHFLFNALNSTAALIYDDPPRADQSIIRLSDLYRRVLSISSRTYIPLSEEIEVVQNYLELEKLRFDDSLAFHIACPDELKNRNIPGLLIEPLVENAVKHGIDRAGKEVKIEVEVKEEEGYLILTVKDDGPGFDVHRASIGFGLFSIQERLRLLFGDKASMHIESSKEKGTKVTLRIPEQVGPTG